MQIPIPQSGPRGSPRTEVRHGSPAIIIAAATLVSAETRICFPFTVMLKPSLDTIAPLAEIKTRNHSQHYLRIAF
jgi:hypothetical protein